MNFKFRVFSVLMKVNCLKINDLLANLLGAVLPEDNYSQIVLP
jgi:hypothetical protein